MEKKHSGNGQLLKMETLYIVCDPGKRPFHPVFFPVQCVREEKSIGVYEGKERAKVVTQDRAFSPGTGSNRN